MIFRFFLLVGFLILVTGCNYNYFLGEQYEARKLYEQANIEYHQAYVNNPENEKYEEAFQRTADLTVEDMRERYLRYIPENLFLQAHNLLQRALILDPLNSFFLEELEKWQRILLIGKVELDFLRLHERLTIADEMEFVVRFNTPNQDRLIITEISLEDGLFFAEDFLYNVSDSFLVIYTINSIGVVLSSNLQNPTQLNQYSVSSNFESFYSYGVPVLSKTSGSLDKTVHPVRSIFEQNPNDSLKSLNEDYLFAPNSIFYSVEFSTDKIEVNSDASSINFLPEELYFNEPNNRILFNFGELELKFFEDREQWGLRKLKSNKANYLKNFQTNIILYPYFFYSNGKFALEKT